MFEVCYNFYIIVLCCSLGGGYVNFQCIYVQLDIDIVYLVVILSFSVCMMEWIYYVLN